MENVEEKIEGKELVRQVLENRAKVAELKKSEEQLHKHEQAESYRIQYDVYQPQIRNLENLRDREIEAVRADIASKIADKQVEVTELMVVVKHVGLILDYLRLDSGTDLELKNVRVYRNQYLEDLGYLFDEHYLKVKLFIYENRKPVNKYTLAAIGKCLFYEELLKLPRSYGTDIQMDSYASLEMILKEGPRIDGLKEWLTKNRVSLLKDELFRYNAVKAEYEHTIQYYKPDDFRPLFKYICEKCGYFYTVFDNYSWHEPIECPHDHSTMSAIA